MPECPEAVAVEPRPCLPQAVDAGWSWPPYLERWHKVRLALSSIQTPSLECPCKLHLSGMFLLQADSDTQGDIDAIWKLPLVLAWLN